MFVGEVIGEEYKGWKPSEVIVINAQTGAGKTYFVLNELLPYIAEKGETMLYLCNRTALREQVLQDVEEKYMDSVCVINYQAFAELRLQGENLSETAAKVKRCSYLVMDEAHYFLADSAFNGDIAKSLDHIKFHLSNAVRMFITATPEYLMLSLAASGIVGLQPPDSTFYGRIGDNCYECQQLCGFLPWERNKCGCYPGEGRYSCMGYLSDAPIIQRFSRTENLLKYKELSDVEYWNICRWGKNGNTVLQEAHFLSNKEYFQNLYQRRYEEGFFQQMKEKCKYYTMPHDYTYIEPVYFSTLNQLCERIINTPEEEKWLVFVSSKKLGEDIKDNLIQMAEDYGREADVVVISSSSKNLPPKGLKYLSKDRVAYQSIIQNSRTENRITISTAVLDNGINLKDSSLKHIAILEMNRTSFVQMLGRKRLDREHKEIVQVYFWARDIGEAKAYFGQNVLRSLKFLAELKFVQQFVNPLDYIPYWRNCESFQAEYQPSGSFESPYKFYVKPTPTEYSPTKRQKDYLFHLFEVNPLTTAKLIYDYYRLAAMLEKYTNIPEEMKNIEKEVYWLKYQLSWFGLSYDPSNWIDYDACITAGTTVNGMLKKGILSKEDQEVFRKAFIQFARTSHPPLISRQSKASIGTINKVFKEYQIPYQIKSEVRHRKTYWIVLFAYEEY